MLEELTPQLLGISMLLIVLLAPPLALLLSAFLLWRYKRAVLRAMASSATGGSGASDGTLSPVPSSANGPGRPLGTGLLLAHLLTAPRLASGRVALGGLAYALTMAIAVLVVDEQARTLPRFALAVWVALWPVIPALALTAAAPLRTSVIALAVYVAPIVVIISALLWPTAPMPTFGDQYAVIRASWTPPEVLNAWLRSNVAPTVLLLLFLNRWTRAVGPLVVTFVTLVLIGCLVSILAFATRSGMDVLGAAGQATSMSFLPVLAGVLLLAAALGAVVGVAMLHRVRLGYLNKTLNDRSLTLDAVWLVFAAFHGMLFVLAAGLGWVAIGVLGWLAYRFVSRLPVLRARHRHPAFGLVFLRVFSLGRRSEKLFDALARYWRHVGSIQLITGPDLAHSTVQPHQFLDFVSRRLAGHFIGDERSLVQRIAQCDRTPDADGLYRVNSLFCHADTWEAALVQLVGQGDAVLMDLRSFGKSNSGCIAELSHLVHRVPLARCTFIVDDTTDREFLQHTLRKVWEEMPPHSPNWASDESAAPLQKLDAGHRGLVSLLGRLAVPT